MILKEGSKGNQAMQLDQIITELLDQKEDIATLKKNFKELQESLETLVNNVN